MTKKYYDGERLEKWIHKKVIRCSKNCTEHWGEPIERWKRKLTKRYKFKNFK